MLFVHQNFPGQFPHLAPALASRGHEVLALTCETNQRPSPVRTLKYARPRDIEVQGLGRTYAQMTERGWMAARGARALRDRHNYTPDVIVGHTGWGETLFLREIWPAARLLVYAELTGTSGRAAPGGLGPGRRERRAVHCRWQADARGHPRARSSLPHPGR